MPLRETLNNSWNHIQGFLFPMLREEVGPLTTQHERLAVDGRFRRLCGWERARAVPSESTFSRAFAEFAASGLPSRVHEALIKRTHKDRLVGHISRDATAIEAREKPVKVPPAPETPKPWPPPKRRGDREEGAAAAGASNRHDAG